MEGLKIKIEKDEAEDYRQKFNNFIDKLKNISKHSQILTKNDIINSLKRLIKEGTAKLIVLEEDGIEIIKIK